MIEKVNILKNNMKSKTEVIENASNIDYYKREEHFYCAKRLFKNDALKQFKDDGTKYCLLVSEIISYSEAMRQCFLEADHRNTKMIQDRFWLNTMKCLTFCDQYNLIEKKPYRFEVETPVRKFEVVGTMDYAVQLKDCDFASATIQSFASRGLAADSITHAVTQVHFEVSQLEHFMGHEPLEYAGLVQNGLEWTLVRRLVKGGKVTWTHMRARRAFTADDAKVSKVNRNACKEIARLLEHVFCVADDVSEAILHPQPCQGGQAKRMEQQRW